MAGAFVLALPGPEMTAVVAGVKEEGVLAQPLLVQCFPNAAQVVVQAVYTSQVIGIFLGPIPFLAIQIAGHLEILEPLF